MRLFREEAVEAKRRKLWGEVRLSQPPSFTIWAGTLSLVCAGALVVVTTVELARKETVVGVIAPEGGLIQISAPREGLVAAVPVAEGARVAAGDVLFEIADSSTASRGGSFIDAQIQALAQQQKALADKRHGAAETLRYDQDRIAGQIRSTQDSLAALRSSITVQKEATSLAEQEWSRFEGLARRGFAPAAEADRRRRQFLAERASLINLESEAARAEASLTELQALRANLPVRHATDGAVLLSEESALAQRRSELELTRGQVVTAPVAGRISYLSLKPGQSTLAGQPALTIIPDNSGVEAQLFVPSRAAGLLLVGQPVRLQIQAFPYQQYGFVEGSITHISRSLVTPGDPSLPITLRDPAYRVRVHLNRAAVMAYGELRPLRPGMDLVADVELGRGPLWRRLLDPLISASQRL